MLHRRTPLKARSGLRRGKPIQPIGRDRFASPTVKRKVFKRDGAVCRYCQEVTAWEDGVAEHVLPRGRGGATVIENLVWACRPCNRAKGNMTGDEFRTRRRDQI